jgi:hypothetical protein
MGAADLRRAPLAVRRDGAGALGGAAGAASSARPCAWATAVKTARALLTVSWYSAAGTES